MRQAWPVTADELDVGAARCGGERGGRPAFEALHLAGEECLQADDVGLELDDLEFYSLPLGKAARHHQEDAGVALRLDDAVPPLRVARMRRNASSGRQQQRRERPPNLPDPHPCCPSSRFGPPVQRRPRSAPSSSHHSPSAWRFHNAHGRSIDLSFDAAAIAASSGERNMTSPRRSASICNPAFAAA